MPMKHFLNQEQLESLTSPVRLAIIQRLEVDRAATTAELARRMGRPVTALYHHLKQLEEIGLVRVVEERQTARRPEAVYALVADYLSSAEVVKTAAGRQTYGRSAARVADAGARTFSAAIAQDAARFEGEGRNALIRFYALRADTRTLGRLNALLDELDEAATHGGEEGEEIQLTILMSPIPSKG